MDSSSCSSSGEMSVAMALNKCSLCLNKQRRIDELEEEIVRLRAALGREHRSVIDIPLVKPEKIFFNLHKRYC